jgi:glycine/D-amino acid oxidase-like deaminating enzyme
VLLDGRAVQADRVVVAAGAWTPQLLPELSDRLAAIGQPVFHLRPTDPSRFEPPHFLPWAADIAHTGWYGFPTIDGVVKVAHHGRGRPVDPDGERHVDARDEERLRGFLESHLPELAGAPVVHRRLCLYCDTFDGDFLIDAHPNRPGVVVASGGSGHGFKFAPVLGRWAADAVEGRPVPPRLRWRELGDRLTEAARSDV